MSRSLWFAVLALSCTPTTPMVEPEPTDTDTPYEGETSNGVIPELEPEPNRFEDAGEVLADRRCCWLGFRIDDVEASNVDGVIVGNGAPFSAGVRLERDGGVWSTAACVPLKAAIAYQYLFTERADGGVDGGEDAGEPALTSRRASTFEPSESDGLGGQTNLVGPFDDCAAADASVGVLP